MNLSVDLLAGKGRRKRDRALLAVSIVALVGAWLFYSNAAERVREREAASATLQRDAAEAKARADETSRGSAKREAERLALSSYRMTLPWAEVLDALEAVDALQAVEIHFDVDKGVTQLKVTGPADESFSKGLDDLVTRLPKWRVRVTEEVRKDGRASASLQLTDSLRPSVPTQ